MFLDDFLMYYKSKVKHLEQILRVVFKVLKTNQLTPRETSVNLMYSKWTCSFKQGDMVIDPIKIKVVQGWLIPKDKTIQIRSFQGLANYYRQFVKGFAQIAKPLTNLLKGKNNSQAIAWNEKCEQNFKVLDCL